MMVSLSVGEILAFLTLLFAIVGVWINMRVKIQKIETTTTLKILELENKMRERDDSHSEWVNDVKNMIERFLVDNKEEHRAISHDVKNIRQSINAFNVRLAEFRAEDRTKQYDSNNGGQNETGIKMVIRDS